MRSTRILRWTIVPAFILLISSAAQTMSPAALAAEDLTDVASVVATAEAGTMPAAQPAGSALRSDIGGCSFIDPCIVGRNSAYVELDFGGPGTRLEPLSGQDD